MVDKSNSTTNHTIHLFPSTAFYSWKRMTISKHHNQLILPFWEITLFKLQWQWNCADGMLHGTSISSVPEAVLISLWMLYSYHIPILSSSHTLKTAYLLCLWNPWNTLLSSFWYCLGSSGTWFWSCASTSQVSISRSGLWEYSLVELQIMWEVREARAWQKKSGSRIAYIAWQEFYQNKKNIYFNRICRINLKWWDTSHFMIIVEFIWVKLHILNKNIASAERSHPVVFGFFFFFSEGTFWYFRVVIVDNFTWTPV